MARKKVVKSPGGKAPAAAKSGKGGKSGQRHSSQFLAVSGAGRSLAVYQSKAALFRQGDPTGSIYQIRKGQVQISVLSKQGKAAVIALLGVGDFVGEGTLAGQPLHLATATALVETEVLRITKATMVKMLHEQPAVSAKLMTFLLSRYIEIEADLVDHLFNSSERRLARVLLLLANFGKDGTMKTIPKISQEMLAARVGTTRSRVNFFMNKFRELGFIEYNGSLKVHSSLLNVIVHD